ncbi:MAG: hypothetical protein JNL13_11535, partial [Chitinophagaceae bacterium]|nr:hypothetical protein [Chitinophagaceae bacterium]
MIDEELQIDPDYQKGFNSGYIVAKEDPALFDQLVKSKNEHHSFFQGMKAGGKEYIKEKFKDELQRDREQRDRIKGKEREKE